MANTGHTSTQRHHKDAVESSGVDLRAASKKGMSVAQLRELASMANVAKVALAILVGSALLGLWHNLHPDDWDEAITWVESNNEDGTTSWVAKDVESEGLRHARPKHHVFAVSAKLLLLHALYSSYAFIAHRAKLGAVFCKLKVPRIT
eukprot:8649172-Pyramimonas_sp.AAC.1